MGLDHHRVSSTVSRALSGPGGVALVVKVFAGLPGVTYPPALRGLFSKSPERVQIGDWRYELAPDGRLRAAHLVHGIVIAEESLDAAVVAARCGAALVVARKDASRTQALRELVASFQGASVKLAGVVFNER